MEVPKPKEISHPPMDQLQGLEHCIGSNPCWVQTIDLGFQHYILALGTSVMIPSFLVPLMAGSDMNLLDRAVKMVVELDEPAGQNYVRKHVLEQAQALGVEVREAATSIFSYSSNINLAVENSSWNDEKQLHDMYLSRNSFAFDSDAPGAGMTEKIIMYD